MKIDKQELIDLLADKTGMERDEIKAQLEQLIARIIDAAERGKALEVKEFGLFYFDDDGDLKFEPAGELRTEINFKYAGMQPVELNPRPGRTDAKIPEPQKEDPDAVTEEPGTPVPGTDSDSPEPAPEKKKKPQPAAPAPAQKTKPSPSFAARYPQKRKSGSSAGILIAIILILLLLAAGYFFYSEQMGTASPDEPSPAEQSTTQSPANGAESNSDILTPLEPGPTSEVGEGNSGPGTETETGINGDAASEESTSLYGLRGEVQEEANDGYSIVLHSLETRERADEIAGELRDEGYRVLVAGRIVQGETVWRVSVGQFANVAEAQEQAEDLPSPYRTQNFIQRIQIN